MRMMHALFSAAMHSAGPGAHQHYALTASVIPHSSAVVGNAQEDKSAWEGDCS